ncbi:phosphopantetheine adenylyltransferase [Paraburkholderia gardini]|jgi:nicotinamide riboside transporter PnuC|uniref:Phosphopantetheine adenylyltransferase n=1 Tax=Paraburkholderia gardini TaxID=2823469 RepID=A0ABN7QPQ9_9BURK|nr:phosphopantetheine adenylyltransferase [Paraburkholderia gardini]CAG4899501.1 hypothetical protein R54767_02537 [Paraburkholderia gardini]CAG4910520.1 hypothetical protein R69919_03800 [Paraburkholderia gardini]
MKYLIAAPLIIVGIIHLLPVSGVSGVRSLASLYGIALDEPSLTVLMRHRAVLFGLLGAFLIYAAFDARLQPLGYIAGLVSVGAFLYLACSTGHLTAQLWRVVLIDVLATVALVIGAGARCWQAHAA